VVGHKRCIRACVWAAVCLESLLYGKFGQFAGTIVASVVAIRVVNLVVVAIVKVKK